LLKELELLKKELSVYQIASDTNKLFLNSTFGKLGSKYSILYSPDLLIKVTVTGQLALLMLIEAIEDKGIPGVSANTDGIVMKCPKAKLQDLEQCVWEWETATRFEMEETRNQALYSRDVNNFIAIKGDGKHKVKGVYESDRLSKSPSGSVCVDAVLT